MVRRYASLLTIIVERYSLHYTNHQGKQKWQDDWVPVHEQVNFKTLKEAKEYLAILSESEHPYIIDNVTNKIIK